jgi:hypothetical protein
MSERESEERMSTTDDALMKEQLGFIYNVSRDINKLAASLVEKPLDG